MNTCTLKNYLAASLFLGLSVSAPISSAASKSEGLGNDATATDYYRVTCATSATNGATHHLSVSIVDLSSAGAATLSVQATKGIFAINTSDPSKTESPAKPGPGGVPWANIYNAATKTYVKSTNSGNGVYDVRVNKTASGLKSYRLNYTCQNSANLATVSSIAIAQNQ